MATTIIPATLTSTIQESISLNGQTHGNTIIHTTQTQGKVYQRIMELPRGEYAQILALGSTDRLGTIIGDEMKYLRITNVDDTNNLVIQLQYASANNWIQKIGPHESFILMNNQSAPNGHATTPGTLEDLTAVFGMGLTESVEIEMISITS
jgi:hypothetical protein